MLRLMLAALVLAAITFFLEIIRKLGPGKNAYPLLSAAVMFAVIVVAGLVLGVGR